MRLLTRLEGRVPALHSVLTRSHARRFDALAPKWDAIRSDVGDSQRMLEYALDGLGIVQPARVLDVGTGTGQAAGILAARYPEAQIDAVDASAQMIELARAKPELARVRFAVSDGAHVPFGDASLRPGRVAARAAVRRRVAPRAGPRRLGALLLPDGAGDADLVPELAGRAAPQARRLRRGALRCDRPGGVDGRAALTAEDGAPGEPGARGPGSPMVSREGTEGTGDHGLPARFGGRTVSSSMVRLQPWGKG